MLLTIPPGDPGLLNNPRYLASGLTIPNAVMLYIQSMQAARWPRVRLVREDQIRELRWLMRNKWHLTHGNLEPASEAVQPSVDHNLTT